MNYTQFTTGARSGGLSNYLLPSNQLGGKIPTSPSATDKHPEEVKVVEQKMVEQEIVEAFQQYLQGSAPQDLNNKQVDTKNSPFSTNTMETSRESKLGNKIDTKADQLDEAIRISSAKASQHFDEKLEVDKKNSVMTLHSSAVNKTVNALTESTKNMRY